MQFLRRAHSPDCLPPDSNPRLTDYESRALPNAPLPHAESSINHTSFYHLNGDFVSLRSMINDINLTNPVQDCDDINDKWDCFHKTIADCENIFVPVKRKSADRNKKQWKTKELKNLAKKKAKELNTYLGTKSFYNWTFYEKIRNSATNAVKVAKINFEYKLVEDMRDNPKAFWKYVRSTHRTKENVADLGTCKKGIYVMTCVSKPIF